MRYARLLYGFVFALFLFSGCSEDRSPAPITATPNTNPDNNTFSDVTTPFDPIAFIDPATVSEPPTPSISSAYHEIYHISITWGDHTGAPSTMPIIDWSGGLSINGAGMIVLQELISFEHGQDSLLPRNFPTSIGWTSMTSSDLDGIAFDFYHADVVYIVEPHLGFRTHFTSFELSLSQLAKLDTVIKVDAIQSVHVVSRLYDPRHCPEGRLAGDWTRTTNTGGTFAGDWKSSDGQLMGRLSGVWSDVTRYGTDSANGYFYGKWASADGAFQGYLKGRWRETVDMRMCPAPYCGGILGFFNGIFTDERGLIRGELSGNYDEKFPASSDREFVFDGEWHVRCRPRPTP